MLNSFPQTSGNPDLTMQTYEAVLSGVPSPAVVEAAQRFTTGEVLGQNKVFAPSVAEFVQEARRIAAVLPHRGRKVLAAPHRPLRREPKSDERARMCLKLPLLQAAIRNGRADLLAEAERNGLAALIALAKSWSVPVADDILAQLGRAA
ncbi:hypothetical protein ACHMW7_08970 [Aminobacter sp. UC22_36]|uniref:hypothetical protein n=1 Tax=Aminobacter sp. UC22_36 TaxID=3374549 RepID=UPI0037569A30